MKTVVQKGDFCQHASRYLTAVEQSGKELTVTCHGKPVLRIVPEKREAQWGLTPFRTYKVTGNINEPVLPPMDL